MTIVLTLLLLTFFTVLCYGIIARGARGGSTTAAAAAAPAPSDMLQYSVWEPDPIDERVDENNAREKNNHVQKQDTEEEEEHPAQTRLNQLAQDFFETPSVKWENLVAIGDMYARGAFPVFAPDSTTAELCYKAASMAPDSSVSGIAQMKLFELKLSPVVADDISSNSRKLDPVVGRMAHDEALKIVSRIPWQEYRVRPRFAGMNRNDETVDFLINPNDNNHPIAAAAQQQQQPHEYKTDAQNVHDHAVMQAIAKNVVKFTDESDDSSLDDNAKKVIRSIQSSKEMSPQEKHDAVRVVRSLSESTHSKFKKSERQVLSGVVAHIEASDDKKEEKYELLGKQLASAVENGNVVCSSGKIARMTSALQGVEDDVEPVRPMWAIRDEIANMAARCRNVGKSAAEFSREATDVYIRELGMNEAIVAPVISEYAEHIIS